MRGSGSEINVPSALLHIHILLSSSETLCVKSGINMGKDEETRNRHLKLERGPVGRRCGKGQDEVEGGLC